MGKDHRSFHEMRETLLRNKQLFMEDVHYNMRNSSFKKKLIAFSKLLLLLFIMIGVPIILFILTKNTLFNREYLSHLPSRLEAHKVGAGFVLVGMQMLQIVVCFLPGQPIQFASSYIYGLWGGYFISIIGAIIGTVVTYKLAGFLGHDALYLLFGEKKVREYMKKLNSGRAMTVIFLIYLIPGIPKDVISYVAGISDMKLSRFLIVSTIGRSPGIIESLLVGAFWAQKNYLGVAAVSVFACGILYICFKKKDAIMKFIDSYEEAHDAKE